MNTENIFANLPDVLPDEVFQTLWQNSKVKIERIISQGHTSPDAEWYDQAQDEWVILLQGKAALQFAQDQSIITLNPGDYVFIPAHQQHRVAWTDPNALSVWLAIHLYH